MEVPWRQGCVALGSVPGVEDGLVETGSSGAPSGRLDVRRVSGVERTEPRRTATGLGTLCVREQSARRACQRPKPAVAISNMGAERCGRPMQMRPTCASRVGAGRGAYRLPGDDQRNVRRAGQRPRPAAATSRMVQDWRTHARAQTSRCNASFVGDPRAIKPAG